MPAEEVYAEAVKWAGQFAARRVVRPPRGQGDPSTGASRSTSTPGLEIERQQFAALFATRDRTTGMDSFVQNGPGKAQFEGR